MQYYFLQANMTCPTFIIPQQSQVQQIQMWTPNFNPLFNFNYPQQTQIQFSPTIETFYVNPFQEPKTTQVQHNMVINEEQPKIKRKRGIDKDKQLQSAKKNSESNIINQFFSYFSCRSQSEDIAEKAVLSSVQHIEDLQKILSIFYNILKCMSLQRVKKYVNKKTLLNIFERNNIEKEIPDIIQKVDQLGFISIDEICEVIRKCCFYFLRNISLISILASKRISAVSKNEHMKKRRMLCGVVSGKI